MSATPSLEVSEEAAAIAEDAKIDPAPRPLDTAAVRRLAVRAAYWTVAAYGANQALRLASNLVLTRLLAPDLFGVMALASTYLAGLNMFSDIGTSASIIRSPRGDDPAFLNSAWTLQVVRGFGLWAGSALIAWPVASFYGDSRLQLLLPLVGFSTVISGFGSTQLYLLNRHLRMGRAARYEFATQAISLFLTLSCVWLSPTVWALAIGGLLGAGVRAAWSHCLGEGPPNRLYLDRSAVHELVTFGKWLFLSTAALFLGEQIDRLTLGKLLSMKMLGVYGVAATLADLPRQVSMMLNSKVVFPAIAKLTHLPRSTMRAEIVRNRKPVIIAAAVGLALFIAFGDLVIVHLYDRRYHQAAWILPLLALSIWPRVLCNTIEPALYAVGRPQYSTLANLLRFLTTLVGIPLGFAWLGLPGAVIAVTLNDFPYYAAANVGLRRQNLSALAQDAKVTLLLVATLAAATAVRTALTSSNVLDAVILGFRGSY